MIKNKNKIVLYIVLLLLCVFLACVCTNYDYDLFARLIVGERFLEYGILPYKDFLSYTPTHPWYDHEWGSGVVFYALLKYFGAGGFIIFLGLMMFLTAIFIIKTQRIQKHSYPVSIIFMSIFLVLFWRLNTSLVRCQLFSFLFFSIFLYILEGTRLGKFKNLIWFIPLMIIFWNNVHGGVVSGLGLIVMYLFASVVERKPWKKYLAVLIVSGLTLIINPYGWHYLAFLFSATTKFRKYVVEWWPVFAKMHFMYYIYSILFLLLGLYAYIKKRKFVLVKSIILAVTIYLGFAHVKLLSLALISVCALCYDDILNIFIKFKKFFSKIERSLYVVIFVVALTIPLFSPQSARGSENKFPLYEIEFLKLNDIKGNIVVPFGLGSYVSYKLYPNNLIYMDGRYEEVYDDEILMELKKFELYEEGWRTILDKYPTDILMLQKYSEMYYTMQEQSDWVLIFEGKICGIFVKKDSEKNSYYEPNYDINYYRKTMFNHGDFRND